MLSTELHRGVVGSVPLLTLQWHQQDPALQFDDKRALRRALDHYVQLGFCDRAQRVESQFPPRRVIEEFFGEVIALSARRLDEVAGAGAFTARAGPPEGPAAAGARAAGCGRRRGRWRPDLALPLSGALHRDAKLTR